MSQIADFFLCCCGRKLKLKVNKTSEGHKNCECCKSNSRIQFIVSRWSIEFILLIFSISSLLIIFCSHFWLSVIIKATMRQRTNSSKPSNISKIRIVKWWWNQEMTPYKIFRKIINMESCRSYNFYTLVHFIFVMLTKLEMLIRDAYYTLASTPKN